MRVLVVGERQAGVGGELEVKLGSGGQDGRCRKQGVPWGGQDWVPGAGWELSGGMLGQVPVLGGHDGGIGGDGRAQPEGQVKAG